MRKANIPLDVLKMPTLLPGFKLEECIKFEVYKVKVKAANKEAKNKRGKRVRVKLIVLDEDLPKLSMKLIFFNLISIMRNLIASNIFHTIY